MNQSNNFKTQILKIKRKRSEIQGNP